MSLEGFIRLERDSTCELWPASSRSNASPRLASLFILLTLPLLFVRSLSSALEETPPQEELPTLPLEEVELARTRRTSRRLDRGRRRGFLLERKTTSTLEPRNRRTLSPTLGEWRIRNRSRITDSWCVSVSPSLIEHRCSTSLDLEDELTNRELTRLCFCVRRRLLRKLLEERRDWRVLRARSGTARKDIRVRPRPLEEWEGSGTG